MAIDAYSPCPCGSGKKFKWCCQPIHVQIDKAYQQEAEGQHDAALRIMEEVIAANPANPEAYGRKAQLLYQNGRGEEAEAALQKALDINPNYPFGHLLRGLFRQEEGEIPGALMLFRKAAELYDPEARDYLGRIYSLITECEFKMNRPLAAHAALKLAVHYDPASEELRRGLDDIFGDKSRLPRVARRDYTFLSPPASTPNRDAWNKALTGGSRLSDAARTFDQLTKDNADDAAAWYNLGLARAWLGDNRGAIEALDHYVGLEPDETRASAAWAIAEVMLVGKGMEDVTDYVEYSALFQIRDPHQFSTLLEEWQREKRFVVYQVNQEQGMVTGLVLEKKAALTPELAVTQLVGLGGYALILVDHLRLWHTNAEALGQIRTELSQRAGAAVQEVRYDQSVANFEDLLAETLFFPQQAVEQEEMKKRLVEQIDRFFEQTWMHRPLKSLGGLSPVNAVGQEKTKKKLRGIVQFLEESSAPSPAREYDFNRLRQKLGLQAGGAAAPVSATAPPTTAAPDIRAMAAADLAGLKADSLADDQLEQAFQTAIKLDARDLAGNFARTLVARPPAGDRFSPFSHIIQQSVAAGDTEAALNYLNDAEKYDCEHNEGRRRNDYELRRGQLHAKRGEADLAQDVFERLIQRVPSEIKFRGSAAEAMLSARQPARALQFAEQGLSKARELNNRDSEQYMMELVEAAKRMK